jgi:predicted O-methyltransferase YrrM
MINQGKTVHHLIRYLARLDRAATQTTSSERAAIAKFAAGKMRALEIGVFEGSSTAIIAKNLHPEGRLLAIDPFFAGRFGICWAKLIAKQELRRSNVSHKVSFIEKLSHHACKDIPGTFDYVFIDGDHSLSAIEKDWKDWASRVEAHGVILLHDTALPENSHGIEFGSHRYFREVISRDLRFEIVELVDSLNILRRL